MEDNLKYFFLVLLQDQLSFQSLLKGILVNTSSSLPKQPPLGQ
jgi:hypothetical protein